MIPSNAGPELQSNSEQTIRSTTQSIDLGGDGRIRRPAKAKFSDGIPSCVGKSAQRYTTIVAPTPMKKARKTNSDM
jgi:hypothetical protein